MTVPVVILGGGLAGAAAAAGLARAGANVTLLEREAGPTDKICGEFLSIEAQKYLTNLGIDLAPLGGHNIQRLTLVRRGKCIEAPLPFQGLGISRRRLDEALLDHATKCGARVIRGHAVNRIIAGADITVETGDTRAFKAKTLFLATGKHEMRGFRRATKTPEDLVGFKMYFRLNTHAQARLAGRIALILFAGGYAGLQLVEDQKANLCLLASRARLNQAGGIWAGLLDDLRRETPYLASALSGAEPLLEKPLTIFRVPYGYVHRPAATDDPRIFRLGDQAGVIPSFTGDGMAIALHSAARAVSCHLNGESATAYHKRLATDISGQIGHAIQLYALAQNPWLQPVFFGLARLWPQGLGLAALMTRVPERARAA
jgi:flavin-dependent dehydrogenase